VTPATPAPLSRRLGAALYDLLVVVALWMFVYFPLIAAGAMQGTLADSRDLRHWALRGAIAFLYFGWCWTRGGRTLGLLAWGLAIESRDGGALGWRDAALRFAVACGYLLPLVALETASATPSPLAYAAALLGPFLLGTAAAALHPTRLAAHEALLGTRAVRRAAG